MIKSSKTNAKKGRSMILDDKKIYELREKHALTQGMLAEAAGVGLRTVEKAESGKEGVGFGSVSLIAKALGVTPADLRPDTQPGNQPVDNSIGRTPHPSPQDAQNLRQVIARGNRGDALTAMAAADGNQMHTQGWEDGYNYPLDKLDYGMLRQIADGTRASVEDADPETTIKAFDRLNRGPSAFRLQHPGNLDYKIGFLDGLLAIQKGFDPQTRKVGPPKRLFGGEA
ncbi:helix-turn-helix domain-containing protein [Sulfitobacter sp. 1A15106]|uniref:helix-turn-helix domain-containing protein n=1 Tax=Sulfitobacter sp. 1A15106 TaxID=3368590 RepID=UPI0037455D20